MLVNIASDGGSCSCGDSRSGGSSMMMIIIMQCLPHTVDFHYNDCTLGSSYEVYRSYYYYYYY